MSSGNERSVVCIFYEVGGFERALDGLLKAGFDASTISFLGGHQAIVDHYGRLPQPDELADAPDTPRESLDTKVSVHKAIDFIAGALAVISETGAASVAYAIGGPVGIAASSAGLTDMTVDSVLSGYVDDRYRDRFERNIRDSGMICWVRTSDDSPATVASQVLAAVGGQNIHETKM